MTRRRVILVHGWNDSPNNLWINWLAGELEARGFEVIAPVFPNPKVPRLERWLSALAETAGYLDRHTVIVGHSLGTATALRFLNDYETEVEIAGLILVAGFGNGLKDRPGALFTPPLDFGRLKARARTRVCIYSDNDRLVSPNWSKRLALDLGARELIVLGGGHFTGGKRLPGSIDRFPAVLEAVLGSYQLGMWGRVSRMWHGIWQSAVR